MINWKLRLQNKVTLTAICVAAVALVYQICGLIGVIPAISESEVINTIGMIINLLCLLGIVVDPTTEGLNDSNLAMTYSRPYAADPEFTDNADEE